MKNLYKTKSFYLFLFILCIAILSICYFLKSKVFRVAVVGPMTGNYSLNGESMKKGIFLCLNNARARKDFKDIKVKVDIFDDKNQQKAAEKIARDIVSMNKHDLVITHSLGSISKLSGEIYKKYHIPTISASTTDSTALKSHDLFFSVIPGNDIQGCFIAYYISNILKYQKVNIIYESNDYGIELFKNFYETAQSLKMSVHKWLISSNTFDETITDIIYDLQSMDDPGIVFMATHADIGAKIISSIKYPGARFLIMGSDTFATDEFIRLLQKESLQERASPGYHSNGIYATSPFLFDIGNQQAQIFQKEYTDLYKEKPDWIAPSYYDSMLLAVNAFKKISFNENLAIKERRIKIKEIFLSFNTYEKSINGVTGSIYMNKNGVVVQPYYVGVYYDQKLVSALDQYQMTPEISSVNEKLKKILKGDMVLIHDRFMVKTPVVYTGIDINEFTDINFTKNTYTMDFYLWFRFKKEFKEAIDIAFLNTSSPLFINSNGGKGKGIVTVLLDKTENNVAIKAYQVKAEFKNDFNFRSFPFDTHKPGIKFRHRTLTKDKIIFIPDRRGIEQVQTSHDDISHNKKPIEGWDMSKTIYYQKIIANTSTLGDPASFNQRNSLQYSSFNAEVEINRKVLNYLIKNFALIFVLIIVTYITYLIPITQFSIRISISMSALLATAFSHIRLTNSISASYLLAAEYAFFGVYAIATLSIFISVILYKKFEKFEFLEPEKKDHHLTSKEMKRISMIGLVLQPLIVFIVCYFLSFNFVFTNISDKVMMIKITALILFLICIVAYFYLKRKLRYRNNWSPNL